eukprot:TRINITY_DN3316_c0_g2_i14.p1 TRINITY_DN3316_c0_g2~~TRINITY_DN3316_c0_g2_i14.p1  ORF type:complete len:222 (+),score=33.72 TRINITY_DN3316_c0_g2_i14:404-1069(+)
MMPLEIDISQTPGVDDDVRVVDIAAGFQHSLFLLSDGRVLSVGDNTQGTLGVPDLPAGIHRNLQVVSSTDVTGNDVNPLSDISGISSTGNHCIAWTSSSSASGSSGSSSSSSIGRAYVWGCGSDGQLGLQARENRPTPTCIQQSYTPTNDTIRAVTAENQVDEVELLGYTPRNRKPVTSPRQTLSPQGQWALSRSVVQTAAAGQFTSLLTMQVPGEGQQMQ